jgi:hypothetical protein
MVTWQGNAPHTWPDHQRHSLMPTEEELDSSEALAVTGEWTEQAEAALSPDHPRPDQDAAGRLLADQLMVNAILTEGLQGPRHQMLDEQLVRYAVPVLRNLLSDGKIVTKAARLGRPPSAPDAWLDFTPGDREEFARDMTADGHPVFTKGRVRGPALVAQAWSVPQDVLRQCLHPPVSRAVPEVARRAIQNPVSGPVHGPG